MSLTRIVGVVPLKPFRLRLTLSDGREVERDVDALLHGPIFEGIRRDPAVFAAVRVESGTIAWPNGADLCPDVVIWGGLPPAESSIGAAAV
ncbi:MAG: DUF2442 domain-containing protein [Proteobacteria bacterium]|jgi:hypothetical protein|nr:DUF2442 domain-containing protein [Pseudomonadota bacterium]